jgi:hypothetical protein
MAAKAKAGEFNVARTVWDLRQTTHQASVAASLAILRLSARPDPTDRPGMWPSGDRPPPAGARQMGRFGDISSDLAWGLRPV